MQVGREGKSAMLVSHTRICTLSLSDSRRRKKESKIDDEFTRTHPKFTAYTPKIGKDSKKGKTKESTITNITA